MHDLEIPLIIALLGLIAVLLCVPLRHRAIVARRCVTGAAVCLFVYFFGADIVGLVAWAGTACYGYLGKPLSIILAGLIVFGCMLVWAGTQDRRENREIRSGSVTAFNNRVETYIREFKYSREKAIEVTTRIRDGK